MAAFRSFSSLVFFIALAAAQKCKLQFDGRVPANTQVAAFDANNIFNPNNVFGQGTPSLTGDHVAPRQASMC